MSRDPLEGYRPSDTARPSVPSAQPVPASSPAAAWTPDRGSRTKVVVLAVVATLIAVIAGAVGFFVTMSQSAPTAKATPTGEMVVKQGPPPPISPTSGAK